MKLSQSFACALGAFMLSGLAAGQSLPAPQAPQAPQALQGRGQQPPRGRTITIKIDGSR